MMKVFIMLDDVCRSKHRHPQIYCMYMWPEDLSVHSILHTSVCGTLVGKLQESEKLHVADEASCMVVFTEHTEMLQVKANFRSC